MSEQNDLEKFHDEVQELGQRVGAPIIAFYCDPDNRIPKGNLRVYAALNALAAVAGMVLAGCEMDEKAMKFFAEAVVLQGVDQLDKADDAENRASSAENNTTH